MSHPYDGIPDARRWSRAMAGRADADIDPVSSPPFRIAPDDRVVTAGSCFAQHLTRHLRLRGHPCFETEPAHPMLDADAARRFGYGVYAARYGNIYTSRQLWQLWQRANGQFEPADDAWEGNGAWYDPFRPTIQPHGFPTRQEYDADRVRHFAAVRRAFTEADVLVFTLGLTECWVARADGAAYPLCPGVAAGTFDPERHALLNLSVDDVVADLRAFLAAVRAVNPGLRLILTVSPVPLSATAEPRHVLVATTYSKAVLRVAAERMAALDGVYYFPAFEIVQAGGLAYFAPDRRSITEPAVERVMDLFFRHVVAADAPAPVRSTPHDAFLDHAQAMVDAMCDETLLDRDAGIAAHVTAEASADARAGARLEAAHHAMARQDFEAAIDILVAACEATSDTATEALLVACRYRAGARLAPAQAVARPLPAPAHDPFATVQGVPEIAADRLDGATLAAGILRHGALLVRGLVSPARAVELARGIDRALEACWAWRASNHASPWYSRVPLPAGSKLADADARDFGESAGGVWAADSPRMLRELLRVYADTGIIDVLTAYFGERPMLSVGKTTLRRVAADIKHADWHQDGAFMGAAIRSVNVWLALSPCGEDASGLDLVARRFDTVLPTGDNGAYFNWSVGQGTVDAVAGGQGIATPRFAAGDALLFDHFLLHRTGIPPGIARDRHAVEAWFFAPSAYPAAEAPLVI